MQPATAAGDPMPPPGEISPSKIQAVVSISAHFSPAGDSPDEKKKPMPPSRLPSRNASSRYDFVKVKVWLGDNADHYYVLSRFLLSRMLTVTKIPNHVAIKIALELKKLLIDNSLLDVSSPMLIQTLYAMLSQGRSQSDLEANLFKLMERRGYGEEYVSRYKMMTSFHHRRVPLVILVCGTACTGKSTIATQLAQRLNLPNVLQTDMVYELLRTSTDAPLTSTPVWARDFSSSEELITEFCRECRIVRKGLAGDLKKAMKDGKPIIIEGIHLDPSIYLMDEENRESIETHKESKEHGTSEEPTTAKIEHKSENASGREKLYSSNVDRVENDKCLELELTEEGTFAAKTEETDRPESIGLADNASEHQGEVLNGSDSKSSNLIKKEKTSSEQIIIPIVLKMAEFDHKALLEEWISTRTFRDKCLEQDQEKLISNLKIIQDYLCSFKEQGLAVVNISATTFPQTLDWLHSYLLQCIERGVSAASSKVGKQAEGN